MARVPVETYVIAQVAPVGPIGFARHPAIGLPPLKNLIVPVGPSGPGRTAGGETCAMNVVDSPATIVFGTHSEVTVESRLTDRTSTGLDDPATAEPGLGAKVALNWAAEAGNVVWQAIVTAWPVGLPGIPLQPLIGLPPLRKAMVPDGPTEPGPAVTGGGNVGSGGASLVRGGGGGTTSHGGGGVRHKPPSTGSNQSGGTGTVSGGNG
jgi:hypothetical protein